MSSSSIRKHAGTGAASDQPAVPEPSFAERARTLAYLAQALLPLPPDLAPIKSVRSRNAFANASMS